MDLITEFLYIPHYILRTWCVLFGAISQLYGFSQANEQPFYFLKKDVLLDCQIEG